MKKSLLKPLAFYMNPATGSVDLGENWLADFKDADQAWSRWGGDKLIEVVPVGLTYGGEKSVIDQLSSQIKDPTLLEPGTATRGAWLAEVLEEVSNSSLSLQYEIASKDSKSGNPGWVNLDIRDLQFEEFQEV